MSRIIDLRSRNRLKVERQNDNIATKCRRTPPFVGFERHYSQTMSSNHSGTRMWTRIQMSCGPTSGYTRIPKFIFSCHLCCALRSHVRVQAEAGPYCCRLVLMSVRMDLRNAFTSKPIRSAWKDHSHENPIPLPLSFSTRSGFHRHRFDMWLKAVCKILIVYNPSRCSSVRLRSDRTERMISAFCPANKAFVWQTVEPTGGKPSSNNLFGRQCWLWLWCEI